MRINTALILCAGFGKRLNPLTLRTPKPLLKINNITLLENCINTVVKLGVKKIFLNTFHLNEEVNNFVKNKSFSVNVQIIQEREKILNTGGGILNMTEHCKDDDFLVLNPDTLWGEKYAPEIDKMQNFYFSNKMNNILLVVKKELSFDQNLSGDFELKKNLLDKKGPKNFIYTGCQILNKNLFNGYKVKNFSITEIWESLLKKNHLCGFESFNKFYHLTNLEIFKKLKDL
jgi:MurNAc alpha-1-phosphate uridylyltransferase